MIYNGFGSEMVQQMKAAKKRRLTMYIKKTVRKHNHSQMITG
jgi:hypothetical protein